MGGQKPSSWGWQLCDHVTRGTCMFFNSHDTRLAILTCLLLAAFIANLDTVVTFVVRSGSGED